MAQGAKGCPEQTAASSKGLDGDPKRDTEGRDREDMNVGATSQGLDVLNSTRINVVRELTPRSFGCIKLAMVRQDRDEPRRGSTSKQNIVTSVRCEGAELRVRAAHEERGRRRLGESQLWYQQGERQEQRAQPHGMEGSHGPAPKINRAQRAESRNCCNVHTTRPVRPHLPACFASGVAALLSVPATYALIRAFEVLFMSEPNPATVVWSPHVAVFWRLVIAGYVSGMVAPLAFLAARRDLMRTTRVLCGSVFVVGMLIGVQGMLMP
jgi:hypothetical protein